MIKPGMLCVVKVPEKWLLHGEMAGVGDIINGINGSICVVKGKNPPAASNGETIWLCIFDNLIDGAHEWSAQESWLHPLPPIELPLRETTKSA